MFGSFLKAYLLSYTIKKKERKMCYVFPRNEDHLIIPKYSPKLPIYEGSELNLLFSFIFCFHFIL